MVDPYSPCFPSTVKTISCAVHMRVKLSFLPSKCTTLPLLTCVDVYFSFSRYMVKFQLHVYKKNCMGLFKWFELWSLFINKKEIMSFLSLFLVSSDKYFRNIIFFHHRDHFCNNRDSWTKGVMNPKLQDQTCNLR